MFLDFLAWWIGQLSDLLPERLGRLGLTREELRATASTSKVTLDGKNDAIASANLQSHVEALAASRGVTVGSTEALPAENRGSFRRIGLRIAVIERKPH